MTIAAAQLALPLEYRRAAGYADFFVSTANADAVAWLDRHSGTAPRTLLVGPEGSGKTHLARLVAERRSTTVIDDADGVADQAVLFHAWNAAIPERPLLLTARSLPRDWARLADLASRLAATPTLTIGNPDDALLAAVLAKHFADRGLKVSVEVANFVLARIDRSFAACATVADALDAAALATSRDVTVPLARGVLATREPKPARPGVIDLSPILR